MGELVIGIVAQVGNNVDSLCSDITGWLKERDYKAETIRLSEFITPKKYANEYDRIEGMQEQGNSLRRESQCNHILSLCAIGKIASTRSNKEDALEKKAFIIRSLKRPEEIEVLRSVYGSAFVCIGVHTSLESRKNFLLDQNKTGLEPMEAGARALRIIDRDETESNYYGQRTRDAYELCDAFVRWSFAVPVFKGLDRVLKLLFGSVFTTPSMDEYGMFLAHSASYRSADLGRQVGAAVLTDRGDVLAATCNEVPRHGGGQFWEGDKDDQRDFKFGEDPNEKMKNKILDRISEIFDEIQTEQSLGSVGQMPLSTPEARRERLKQSGILDITEYGRSVHAEMECLLSCARNGITPKGATLYTTTFPCHNCARHIISAGIKRVVYVEPYPKSKALQLHNSEIALPLTEVDWDGQLEVPSQEGDKVKFEPFVGIGPHKYADWFSMKTMTGKRIERKEGGRPIHEVSTSLIELKSPESNLSYLDREIIAIDQLWKLADKTHFSQMKDEIATVLSNTADLVKKAESLRTPIEWRESKAIEDWRDEQIPLDLATETETPLTSGDRTLPSRAKERSRSAKTKKEMRSSSDDLEKHPVTEESIQKPVS